MRPYILGIAFGFGLGAGLVTGLTGGALRLAYAEGYCKSVAMFVADDECDRQLVASVLPRVR